MVGQLKQKESVLNEFHLYIQMFYFILSLIVILKIYFPALQGYKNC